MIDTHCHLNLEGPWGDVGAEVQRATAAGVDRLVVVGIDLESSKRAVDLATEFEEIYAVVGWHPSGAHSYRPEYLKDFERLAGHPKTVAIGEIGYDFHWKDASRQEQDRCLADQLDLAAYLAMPVVFHCREAYAVLLDALASRPPRHGRYLFHCFSGDEDDLLRAKAMDAYFGIDGPITYKKAAELRRLATLMPRERIVLETDSPYLTPEPHRGKPNRPAYIPLINNALASTLGTNPEECAALTSTNAERFFNLSAF